MTPLPAFFFRRAIPDDSAVLAEGEGFLVTRGNGGVAFECFGPWRREFEEVYRRHDAEAVSIGSTHGWAGRSLDFLRRLPSLRRVSLGIDVPMDLAPLADLQGLESLGLDWRARGAAPAEIDFQRFNRLRECSISWHPSFASALELDSLRILVLHDAPRLKELDVTGLPRLAELDLMSCPALTRINLNERAELIALELADCRKLRPDWRRLAPDLRHLRLGGGLGFAPEEAAEARGLRFLWAELPTGRYAWGFLRDLPRLEGVRIIDLRMNNDLAESIRAINQEKGRGPTLAARPLAYMLN